MHKPSPIARTMSRHPRIARARASLSMPTVASVATDFHNCDLPARSGTAAAQRPVVVKTAPVASRCELEGATAFVATLLACRHDRNAAPLAAGFGDGSWLRIDFCTRTVTAEPAAWARVVARGQLPQTLDEATCPIDYFIDAEHRDLDALVWAVGLACADLPLLGAPLDWRHARVLGQHWLHVYQYTCMPVHLHLADMLQHGPATPFELRRATHVREAELCGFLQACLLLGFAQWDAG